MFHPCGDPVICQSNVALHADSCVRCMRIKFAESDTKPSPREVTRPREGQPRKVA